eukprot:TRINITY_DN25768_c0_g1_i5.p1 TRINITY_DN25768_c0_g1~~TRINITY_DN25768_c0_g1_i5.p1  ORF type:complete len:1242 (-),score=231.31 TRINITY_DN25768_c0_g1_i5:339-4064(-)
MSGQQEGATPVVLGLCGPSELRVPRSRKNEFSVEGVEKVLEAGAAERLASLRSRLVSSVLPAILEACHGDCKVADHIASFLDEEATAGLKGVDYQKQRRRLLLQYEAGKVYVPYYHTTRAVELSTSQSRNVDFFFKALPKTSHDEIATAKLERLLTAAWKEDPEVCLKLLFHLGATKKGKQDRWNFYDGMLWLWETCPTTLLQCLPRVARTVYWKALLEILARVCEGKHLAIQRDKVMYQCYVRQNKRLLASDASAPPVDEDAPGWKFAYCEGADEWNVGIQLRCGDDVEVPTEDGWCIQEVGNGQDPTRRKSRNCGWQAGTRLEQAERAVRKFDSDPLYRALHLKIAALFAEQLAIDEAAAAEGKHASLCAKWAPLLDKSFDRRTLVAESIARMLYPPDLDEFDGLTEQHYSYRARLKYAALLNTLKEYRKEPERLINAKRWSEIKYESVPGAALRLRTPMFQKYDKERFEEYIKAVQSGKAKVRLGALQPHDLMQMVLKGKPAQAAVAAEQWETLVKDVKKQSKFRRCLAVVDFSWSMTEKLAAMGVPSARKYGMTRFDEVGNKEGVTCFDVASALTHLITDVAEEPFHHKAVGMYDQCEMLDFGVGTSMSLARRHALLTSTYGRIWKHLKMNTFRGLAVPRKRHLSGQLYRVFEKLVEMKELPDRLIIFSAMVFNPAADVGGSNPGIKRHPDGRQMTVFEAAQDLFAKAGRALPEIVFWNLSGDDSGSTSAPVLATTPGATLVSGFSASLVKDILNADAIDSLAFLAKVCSAPLFKPLTAVQTKDEAETIVRECLAFEGKDARDPEEPAAPHVFEAPEEWQIVDEVPKVEAEAVAAAEPRRAPLLAMRATRRVKFGSQDYSEDALLALIGLKGRAVREARSVLSTAVEARLQLTARVWIDVDYVEGRLGVIAVTVSARAPLAILKQELEELLVPAVDELLKRATRKQSEAEARAKAWESGEWYAAKQERLAQGRRRREPPALIGVAYFDDLLDEEEGGCLRDKRPSRDDAAAFLPVDAVAPTMALALTGRAREAVEVAASARRREFPKPRTMYRPPPRDASMGVRIRALRLAMKRNTDIAMKRNADNAYFGSGWSRSEIVYHNEHIGDMWEAHKAETRPMKHRHHADDMRHGKEDAHRKRHERAPTSASGRKKGHGDDDGHSGRVGHGKKKGHHDGHGHGHGRDDGEGYYNSTDDEESAIKVYNKSRRREEDRRRDVGRTRARDDKARLRKLQTSDLS